MEKYVIRGGRIGYDRLQVLARARWPDTSALLDRIGVRPGMHCLDVGCGGGAVTLELARLVAPDGEAIGIDMDEITLQLAREASAAEGLPNVEFEVADVEEWTEDATYDLVYCRFLLHHLSDPLGLLQKMWAAVRPGCVIAVEDADMDGRFCDPPNDGFELWRRAYPELLRRRGGDATIGRKLHRYFLDIGIPAPQLTVAQDVRTAGEAKMMPLLTLEATADAILSEGIASETELNTAIADLASFTDDAGTTIAGPRVLQVWSRRPNEH